MHVRDLAELAALVCVHHRQLASASPTAVDDALESYWTASRCRLDRWCRSLRNLTQATALQPARPWSPGATQLVKEIFVSEILTRTVAAVLAAHDQYHGRSESEPIGRNVLAGHLDARRRALRFLASPVHAGSKHSEALGALARRCDRWNDLLLAYLLPTVPVDHYAVDLARIEDFASDARDRGDSTASATTTMLLAGLRMSFDRLTDGDSPNSDLNVAIAAAVIGCFGPEFFDSFGLLRSAWLDRLQAVPDETLALISQWCLPAAKVSAAPPPRRRW
jgi:hypothetical protein